MIKLIKLLLSPFETNHTVYKVSRSSRYFKIHYLKYRQKQNRYFSFYELSQFSISFFLVDEKKEIKSKKKKEKESVRKTRFRTIGWFIQFRLETSLSDLFFKKEREFKVLHRRIKSCLRHVSIRLSYFSWLSFELLEYLLET